MEQVKAENFHFWVNYHVNGGKTCNLTAVLNTLLLPIQIITADQYNSLRFSVWLEIVAQIKILLAHRCFSYHHCELDCFIYVYCILYTVCELSFSFSQLRLFLFQSSKYVRSCLVATVRSIELIGEENTVTAETSPNISTM